MPPATPPTVTAADLLARLRARVEHSAFARAFMERVPARQRLPCLQRLLGPEPVSLVSVEARETIFKGAQSLPGEGLFLVYDGVVEEWQSQFRLSVRRPGDLLGELPALAPSLAGVGQPNAAVARDACRLVPFRGDALRAALDAHPGLVRALLQAVAEHAGEFADDEGQIVEALDEFFPHGFGQVTPGPYDCPDVTLHLFPFVIPDAPDHPMQIARPPGVTWLGRLFFVALVKMRDTGHPVFAQRFSYDEITFFVPSSVDGVTGFSLHIPFIYADNIMAILLGRELAGMPKLQVSTFIEPLERGSDEAPDETPGETPLWRLLARRGDRTELELRFRAGAQSTSTGAAPAAVKGLWDALMNESSLSIDAAAELWSQLADVIVALGDLRLPLWMGLDTVNTTARKRIFRPDAHYTSATGARMVAGPGDFQVDALCETQFKVGQVLDVTPLQLEPGAAGVFVAAGFPLEGCQPLSTRGLRVHLKMQMIGGPVLIDYLTSRRWGRDPARSWGPWVKLARPGGAPER